MTRAICLTAILVLISGCGKNEPTNNAKESGIASGSNVSSNSKLSEKTVGQIKLKPLKALPQVEVLIPDGFTKMSEELMATKYPLNNRPTLVYTNERGSVNIAFNHTQNKIPANQLQTLHQVLDSSIRQAQPNAQWMFSGLQDINGRKWVQLEFNSVAVDTKIHNVMIATSVSDRMMIISFNCTEELADKWLSAGREIIKSVHVND